MTNEIPEADEKRFIVADVDAVRMLIYEAIEMLTEMTGVPDCAGAVADPIGCLQGANTMLYDNFDLGRHIIDEAVKDERERLRAAVKDRAARLVPHISDADVGASIAFEAVLSDLGPAEES